MNELRIFKNAEFGQIRMVEINGKPYFVASDVAKSLGYANVSDAISRHCRWVVKHDIPHPQSNNKTLEVNVIPEGDLYRLVSNSELESAQDYESWVFDEVLPSIRKHGMYATEELLNNPDLLISMATALKEERAEKKKLQAENETMKPKALFADAVSTSNTSILIGDLAKIIKQNGIEIGQKRLFEWLRNNEYLIKRKGSDWNMPTQKAMELRLFEVKERAIDNPDGSVLLTRTTKVTGKGQQYFINKFLAEKK